MTLDEAIKHAEEVADKKDREKKKWERWLENDSDYRAVAEKVSCELCAKEHRQLAEWLKDYKRLLEQEPCDNAVSRQAVKEQMIKYGFHASDMTVTEFIEDLPPSHLLVKNEKKESVHIMQDELISRQAVLNKILKFSVTDGRSVSVTGLWTEVNELPSVTPQEPCEDVIRRKDALMALCRAVHKNDDTIPCSNQRESCLWSKTKVQDYAREISKLPLVTPQQKKGHWGKDGECPFCGYLRQWDDDNFCGHCGAKMIEPQEGSGEESAIRTT